jgi:hypothetical protein
MAQAVSASIPRNPAVQQAAAEVVALINSRPTSPRQDEIEVVIARACSVRTATPEPLPPLERSAIAERRPSHFCGQWETLKQEAVTLAAVGKAQGGLPVGHPKVEEQEALVAALCVSQDAVAHAAWETTARDLADVLLLAEIVWTYHWGLGTFRISRPTSRTAINLAPARPRARCRRRMPRSTRNGAP